MFRLTVKNFLDKKIRFALTTLAVVAGVTMIVAVFTMTDSLRASFDGLASDIAEGTDLTVRTVQTIGSDLDRAAVPQELAETISAIDGVAEIDPGVGSFNTVITDGNGDAILPSGPPTIGTNWSKSQYFLTAGDIPEASDEFAVDATTAEVNDLRIGNRYPITSEVEQREFKLVGIFNFGAPDEHRSLGQTMASFELDTAQDFFGLTGLYSEIGVRVGGTESVEKVQAATAAAVGPKYEVVTSEVIEDETQSNFASIINVFNTILLVFAFIIVFVAAFIINNTFQIVVAQRIRELGLLRAVGATGKQISRSVRLEALIVGVFSTIVGIGLGVVGGSGLRWMLNTTGFTLPSGPIQLQPRTVIWAAVIGIGITFAASLIPARRARTISPVAAINTDQRLAATSLRRRLIGGGIMTGVGAVSLANGLFVASSTRATLTSMGIGAVLVFIGVNTLSPSFARPIAHLLGRPIAKLFGTPGRLAQGNAARSPRRTASTAGALMIGLALVGMAVVVGSSLTKSFLQTLDNAVEADYFVQSRVGNFNPSAGFSQEAATRIEELPEIGDIVRYRFSEDGMWINGKAEDLFSSDFAKVTDHLNAQIIAGGLRDADPATSIAVHSDPARDLDLAVGDTLEVTFPDNETETLSVAAIFDDASIFGNWMVDNVVWEEHINSRQLGFVTATIAGFSDDLPEPEQEQLLAATATALEPVLESFPSVKAENRVEFRQGQQDQLNSFLAVIQVLLALSLVIALIGIANTLALSVFERTREIGLLRAVGMTRRQLRRAVRWEAVIIAVFGAILGLALGVIFGVAAVVAIPDSIISSISIPIGVLLVYVVLAAVAGILASLFPAWRASRMNVLEAIYHE